MALRLSLAVADILCLHSEGVKLRNNMATNE